MFERKRLFALACSVLLWCSLVFNGNIASVCQGAEPAKSVAPRAVLQSMKQELDRNFQVLKKQNPPVYFMAYRLYIVNSSVVAAMSGSLYTNEKSDPHAYIGVEVRVGSPSYDSTHELDEESGDDLGLDGAEFVPVDGDDYVLRNNLWLETEKRFRLATERYGKIMARKDLVPEEVSAPDFAAQSPVKSISSEVMPQEWSEQEESSLTAEACAISKVYDKYPQIGQSWAIIKKESVVTYLVNSEGSQIYTPSTRYSFETGGRAQATDGQDLELEKSDYVASIPILIAKAGEYTRMATQVADNLMALRRAAPAQPYVGPTLMKGAAAAVLFHEALGHRLEAGATRESSEGRTFAFMLGKQVLPPFISVYARPLQKTVGNVILAGHYLFDDEACPASNVTLVDKGILKTFLVGRKPTDTVPKSNGHGRCDWHNAEKPEARMSNLVVESSLPYSEQQLRQRLLAEVRRQKKPYGLLIEEVSAGETQTSNQDLQSFKLSPTIVKRVFVDGRPDQLIRNARIIGTPMSALERIISTASHPEVYNGYCGASSGWVPQSNIAPSILIGSLEIERGPTPRDLPILLPAPDVSKLPSKVESDAPPFNGDLVLKAMYDEMARSKRDLKLTNKASPYFMSYTVLEKETDFNRFAEGALVRKTRSKGGNYHVDVRVGSYDFDSTSNIDHAHLTAGEWGDSSMGMYYGALRRQLWYYTDFYYKDALNRFESLLAFSKSHVNEDRCPSLSPSEAVICNENIQTLTDNDRKKMPELARKVSLVFKEYPELLKSMCQVHDMPYVIRTSNSEGSIIKRIGDVSRMEFECLARTPSGNEIFDYETIALDAIPVDTSGYEEMARKMAKELLAHTKAQPRSYYFGPVLFEGQAAAHFVTYGIGPLLCSDRADNLHPQGTLFRSLNHRVFPEFLSISDDFTKLKRKLPATDEQGSLIKPVKLVDHGYLRDFLSRREPIYRGQKSNGHCWGNQVEPAHLLVETDQPQAADSMRNKLVNLAAGQGLKEAIIIRRIRPKFGYMTLRDGADLKGNEPIEMYSVDVATGQETRIAGLKLTDLPRASFKDIVCMGDNPEQFRIPGWIDSTSIITTTCPALLMSDYELEADGADKLEPYPVPKPAR
jgi:predicted Zn-dependent protease